MTEGAEVALARLLGALRGRERWLLVFDNATRVRDSGWRAGIVTAALDPYRG